MEAYLDVVRRIIYESDLVLEILDARLVEDSRNEQIESLINEIRKPIIFVVNKSDLVSKQNLKKQIKKLKKFSEVVFVSSKNKKSANILLRSIKKVFKKYGKSNKEKENLKYREAKGDIVVGVLGYPNVGKSSVINLLAHKKKAKVGKEAGTTHGIHWIRISKEIKLIDSPGVIPLAKDNEIKYGLIGARNSNNLKNPDKIAEVLIDLFLKNNKKNFEKFYGIKTKSDNSEDIIKQIAEKKFYFLKGGKIDENKTIFTIIRDWHQGKLRL